MIQRALAIALLLAVGVGLASAESDEPPMALDGEDAPPTKPVPARRTRSNVLYWSGTAWAELPPGYWPRWTRQVDTPVEPALPVAATRPAPYWDGQRWVTDGDATEAGPSVSATGDGQVVSDAASSRDALVGSHAERSDVERPVARESGAPDTSAPPEASGTPASPAGSGNTSAAISLAGLLHDGRITRSLFSAQALRDLIIAVQWSNLPPTPSTQEVRLVAPDGRVYQTFVEPITAFTMAWSLPVSGTWITQHQLVGFWRAEVYLNGQAMPTTASDFRLGQ